MQADKAINILDEPLALCGDDPETGFFRDGKCNTCAEDIGSHTVCIKADQQFLEFSRFKGNDLTTPIPEYGFEGLRPGDNWCLCAARWLEAYEGGMAPKVYVTKTHKRALEIIPFALLKKYAIDLN